MKNICRELLYRYRLHITIILILIIGGLAIFDVPRPASLLIISYAFFVVTLLWREELGIKKFKIPPFEAELDSIIRQETKVTAYNNLELSTSLKKKAEKLIKNNCPSYDASKLLRQYDLSRDEIDVGDLDKRLNEIKKDLERRVFKYSKKPIVLALPTLESLRSSGKGLLSRLDRKNIKPIYIDDKFFDEEHQ